MQKYKNIIFKTPFSNCSQNPVVSHNSANGILNIFNTLCRNTTYHRVLRVIYEDNFNVIRRITTYHPGTESNSRMTLKLSLNNYKILYLCSEKY